MGQPKLLLPFGERTVIAAVLDVLRHPAIAETVVVVRSDDIALRGTVEQSGAVVVSPETPPPEMRDSVELALRWIGEHHDPQPEEGWLLTPADHPLLDAQVLERLVARWRQGDCTILVPTCGGRRGHPVLFRWSLAAEVFALPAEAGLNRLVRDHAGDVTELEVASESILLDLDTPEDYARLADG